MFAAGHDTFARVNCAHWIPKPAENAWTLDSWCQIKSYNWLGSGRAIGHSGLSSKACAMAEAEGLGGPAQPRGPMHYLYLFMDPELTVAL